MKYPKFLERFNNAMGIFSGFLVLLLALLSFANAIGRYFFSMPLVWAADASRYLLLFLIFGGAAFGFQVKAHVGVDLLTNAMTKNHPKFKRVLRIIAYIMCLPFIVVITYRGFVMMQAAFAINRLTTAVFQIPQGILYLGIFVGGIFMAVTVIFTILSLIKGEDTWIDA